MNSPSKTLALETFFCQISRVLRYRFLAVSIFPQSSIGLQGEALEFPIVLFLLF